MKLFFKFYFLLNLFIISLQVQANTYKTLTSKEQSASHAIWSLQNNIGSAGTGFFIAPNLIVTNFHVTTLLLQTDELKNIKLLQDTGLGMIESNIKITKIISLSATADLALLETDKSSNSYLTISTTPDKKTQNLFALGYPHKQFSKISQTGPLLIGSNRLSFSTNYTNLKGASGSPVLNSANQVVGIISSYALHFQHSIQSNQLNRLINRDIGFYCENNSQITCINKTIELNLKKAKTGNADAQYELSLIYLLHEDLMKQDKVKAVFWTEQAARQNHILAQHHLGLMYFHGEGVKHNKAKAFEWFKKTTEQNYIPTQMELGKIYLQGIKVKQDKMEAFEWFRKASEQNHAPAQYTLGEMYFFGDGVEINIKKAFEWIQTAAEQNFAPAQTKLGYMYYFGIGVEQDKAKAVFWTRKAAMRGFTHALQQLKKWSNSGIKK